MWECGLASKNLRVWVSNFEKVASRKKWRSKTLFLACVFLGVSIFYAFTELDIFAKEIISLVSRYQTPRNISIVQSAQSSRLSHQNESPSGSASGAHSTSVVTTSSSNGSGYILLQPNSNRPVRLVPLAEASGIISNVNDAGYIFFPSNFALLKVSRIFNWIFKCFNSRTSSAKTMTTLSGNSSGNVHHSAITNKGQRIIVRSSRKFWKKDFFQITGGSSATKSAHNSEPTITVTDSGSVPGRGAMTQQPKKGTSFRE